MLKDSVNHVRMKVFHLPELRWLWYLFKVSSRPVWESFTVDSTKWWVGGSPWVAISQALHKSFSASKQCYQVKMQLCMLIITQSGECLKPFSMSRDINAVVESPPYLSYQRSSLPNEGWSKALLVLKSMFIQTTTAFESKKVWPATSCKPM